MRKLGVAKYMPEVAARIVAERDEGHTWRAIADALNADGVPTLRGARWHASTVQVIGGYKRPPRRKHGLSEHQYLTMLANGCSICGRWNRDRRLCIDHDHTSGKVRGALCSRCNSGIGFFQDSADLLLRAARYLERA